MGGRHYNVRMSGPGTARAALLDAVGATLRGAGRDPFRMAILCTCQHPAAGHQRNVGCLDGWSDPAATDGCLCVGSPPGCQP